MTTSFVHSIKLASDERLAAFRPARPLTFDAIKRGVGGEAGQPLQVSDKLRAAVDAGSIVSFVSGLNAEQMSDVLYSTQLAQRAASAKFDRFAAIKEWYGAYIDVLERLGWVGEGLAFSQRDTSAGQFSMDKAALDVIATVATGNQLAILVKTLDTLKKLGEADRPLRIFDLQAMKELSGISRLVPRKKPRTAPRQWRSAPSIFALRTTEANSCFSLGAPKLSRSGPQSAR